MKFENKHFKIEVKGPCIIREFKITKHFERSYFESELEAKKQFKKERNLVKTGHLNKFLDPGVSNFYNPYLGKKDANNGKI